MATRTDVPASPATAVRRHTVVAVLPSTVRPTCVQPAPGPVTVLVFPAEANSSSWSPAWTLAGTLTVNEVLLALRVACPTHETEDGGGGGGGGGSSSPPSRFTMFSSLTSLRSW